LLIFPIKIRVSVVVGLPEPIENLLSELGIVAIGICKGIARGSGKVRFQGQKISFAARAYQ